MRQRAFTMYGLFIFHEFRVAEHCRRIVAAGAWLRIALLLQMPMHLVAAACHTKSESIRKELHDQEAFVKVCGEKFKKKNGIQKIK